MAAATLAFFLLLAGSPAPDWTTQLESPSREGAHLVPDGAGGQCVLVPMGTAGLGGWNGRGEPLPGFPLSPEAGVSQRPAFIRGPSGETLIAYGDDSGFMHLVDLRGVDAPGWPVNTGSAIVTGVSVVDLDCDGVPEIAFGTGDGRAWLLGTGGTPLQGWPVNLSSQLLWQPSQVSLGGGSGKGMICALTNASLTVLDRRGSPLPGWPVNLPYPVGCNPVSADVNGDGQADIIFATQSRRLNVFSVNGRQQEGWPRFLDARPVRGAAAVGMVNRTSGTPQIALSTLDSLVYLVNGDGKLAGTWRWPNRTESVPSQPIVVGTGRGPAVLVYTESGFVHAWNDDGITISGFPFQHPGGSLFTPVAGDLNGDGNSQLVVLSRDGRLAAYPLSTPHVETGFWPLPLGDPSNSGSFGRDYLPVARVGDVEPWNSGEVIVPFTVTVAPYIGLTLSFSVDAGYSWTDTRNFTIGSGHIAWDTHRDLPHRIERQVTVRVTPYSDTGNGECGVSRIFRVDNNIPPTIYISGPETLEDGILQFSYAVDEPEGDPIHIHAQFSTDGGRNWQPMRLSGTTTEIAPGSYGEPFLWNPTADLGGMGLEDVRVRIRAADSKPGPWFEMADLGSTSEMAPSAQIVAPESAVSGQVRLGIRLADPEMNPLDVKYEYSTDGGETWNPATVVEAEGAGMIEYRFDILWLSERDLPGFSGNRVRFRALPFSSAQGIAVPSVPFTLENNDPPQISIVSPTEYRLFSGTVPVSFVVSDTEGDMIGLGLEYSLDNKVSWLRASGVIDPGPFGPVSYRSVLYWNSSVDLPVSEISNVYIRLFWVQNQSIRSMEAGPIALDNGSLPEVLRGTMTSPDELTGRALVSYEIIDGARRAVDLAVHFSTDAGRSWRVATVTGNLSGIREGSYSGTFEWHWRTDIMNHRGTVTLRLTPGFDGSNAGRPRVIEQVFR